MYHKEYHPLPDGTQLRFSVSFNKDSHSWFTCEPTDIGYRVNVVPVAITKREGYSIEESGVLTGFNATLLKVDRQSKKRAETALKILAERKQEFIDIFMNKYYKPKS